MKISQTYTALGAIVAVTFSSCTTTNPYTGEKQISKTAAGTLIGAAGGAAIGALSGNNRTGGKSREHAIKGALIGGAVGGGIGIYMDQQEAQIRQQLQGTGVSVTRSGNDLILNMPSDITFKSGSSSVLPRFTSTLGSVALVLKKYKKTSISITGHTDSDGSPSYNQNLSVSRANSVAQSLSRQGVSGSRIQTYGRGEASPIASNSSTQGKAQNRRVELKIVPQSSQF